MNNELEKQFVMMENVCNELSQLENEYHTYENNIADLEEKIEQCKLGKVGKIVVGIIVFYVSNLIIAQFLSGFIKSMGLGYIFILVAIITVAIKYAEKQYVLFKENDKRMFLAEIDEEQKNLHDIMARMKAIIVVNEEAFKNMPQEYIYSIAIVEMHKYVRQGRANTIPQAINMYEEQLHRWKLEEQNDMILDSQYRQEQRLANIEFYSSLSAFFD